MLRFFRRRQSQTTEENSPTRRPALQGEVVVANRTWLVREEKRQGPRPQILILTATDDPAAEMHIRPDPGQEATLLEHVVPLAHEPSHRWFMDPDGQRWETRLVRSDEMVLLIKFICWGVGVFEGPYPFRDGLGVRSDEELFDLLGVLRQTPQ